jgi:hypothetical protein
LTDDVRLGYGRHPIHVPLLKKILDLIGYPDSDALAKDLTNGFTLAGAIRGGDWVAS